MSIASNIAYPIRKLIARKDYYLHNYQDTVWLIGDARSGTTWIADMINYNKKYREMFEPFHPKFIPAVQELPPDLYVGPSSDNVQLRLIADEIFSGRLGHPRVDATNWRLAYSGLLIKDIQANLFAAWALRNFPHLKIILAIRNPFAVALSKYKTKDWLWRKDALHFLNQPNLRKDYIWKFEKLIRDTAQSKDYVLNQILIWSIKNYIPLRQFAPNELCMVFYEDMFQDPSREVKKVLTFVGAGITPEEFSISRKLATSPSRVARKKGADFRVGSSLTSWKNEISSKQWQSGLAILSAFGLDSLYGDDGLPCRAVAEKILSAEIQ